MLSQTMNWHHDFNAPFMGGVGLITEGDLSPHGGIEIGLIYMQQVFSIEQNGLVVVERGKRMYITMGYRHWFTPRVSGALAFFSNYSMSEADMLHSDFPSGQAPATSAESMVKYGFDWSLQWEAVRQDRFSVVLDGRYSLSVTSKPGEDENFYAVLVGLKYFLQGREAPVQ
jgi:hypothetical protein